MVNYLLERVVKLSIIAPIIFIWVSLIIIFCVYIGSQIKKKKNRTVIITKEEYLLTEKIKKNINDNFVIEDSDPNKRYVFTLEELKLIDPMVNKFIEEMNSEN